MAPPGRRPKVNIMVEETKPAPSFLDSPEFAKAVEAAAAAAVAKMLANVPGGLQATEQMAVPGVGGDAQQFFRQMALAIAEISDQGTNRKRVAPEILAARAAAWSRMIEAIEANRAAVDDAKASGDKRLARELTPKWRATGKLYLSERLVDPFTFDAGTKKSHPTEFRWMGAPNELMTPLNAAAKAVFGPYRESLGGVIGASPRPTWVSASGLVIEGRAPARREVHAEEPEDELFVGDLDDLGNNNPNKPLINVYGTVAQPARRNYHEDAPRRGV